MSLKDENDKYSASAGAIWLPLEKPKPAAGIEPAAVPAPAGFTENLLLQRSSSPAAEKRPSAPAVAVDPVTKTLLFLNDLTWYPVRDEGVKATNIDSLANFARLNSRLEKPEFAGLVARTDDRAGKFKIAINVEKYDELAAARNLNPLGSRNTGRAL